MNVVYNRAEIMKYARAIIKYLRKKKSNNKGMVGTVSPQKLLLKL
jgi:hypothetical protein